MRKKYFPGMLCAAPGCERQPRSAGFCDKHYLRIRKNGTLDAQPRESHGEKSGGRTTPEYRAWQNMRERCSNPNLKEFKHYGGRGIRVCPEWDKSFTAFLNYVGRRPSPRHTIDRIETNGHYEPGNVRWATRKVQAQNRRPFSMVGRTVHDRMLTLDGVTDNLRGWAKRLGIPESTLSARAVRGWDASSILRTGGKRGFGLTKIEGRT